MAEFSDLLGKHLTEITNDSNSKLIFWCADGTVYQMYHSQDCCESVYLEDVIGNMADLVLGPILLAEVVSNADDPPLDDSEKSYTWTFYKLATNRGSVTFRWYGSSNGYYSEAVDFDQLF
jgi:hypothetical protein